VKLRFLKWFILIIILNCVLLRACALNIQSNDLPEYQNSGNEVTINLKILDISGNLTIETDLENPKFDFKNIPNNYEKIDKNKIVIRNEKSVEITITGNVPKCYKEVDYPISGENKLNLMIFDEFK
jgi:hypothetical protein